MLQEAKNCVTVPTARLFTAWRHASAKFRVIKLPLTWPNTRADRYSPRGDVGNAAVCGWVGGGGVACRSVGGRWREIMWSPNAGHISPLQMQINSYGEVREVSTRVRIDKRPAGQVKYSSLDVRDADLSWKWSDDHMASESVLPTLRKVFCFLRMIACMLMEWHSSNDLMHRMIPQGVRILVIKNLHFLRIFWYYVILLLLLLLLSSPFDIMSYHHHHHHFLYAGYLYLSFWDKLCP